MKSRTPKPVKVRLGRYYKKRIGAPHYAVLANAILEVSQNWKGYNGISDVMDIGCALGELLISFPDWDSHHYIIRRHGVDISEDCGRVALNRGIDFMLVDFEKGTKETATTKIAKCDVICCMEVAEHIANYENILSFIDLCVDENNQGTTLVWSAAQPGQRGLHHINCQTIEFWKEKLENHGWHLDLTSSNDFAIMVENKVPDCYYRNTRIYRKGK